HYRRHRLANAEAGGGSTAGAVPPLALPDRANSQHGWSQTPLMRTFRSYVVMFVVLSCAGLNMQICFSAEGASRQMVTDSAYVQSFAERSKPGNDFVEAMFASADALNDYSFHYEMAAFKGHNKVYEEGYFSFKRQPRLMKIQITAGPKKGSVAVMEKDGKVHG